jgi:hypothetical protein
MSNWDANGWQLYDDNLVGLLVKAGPVNEFDLESFAYKGKTRWRVAYVPSSTRTMKNFWYQCVFEEAGTTPAPTPGAANGKLTTYPGHEKDWDDVGDSVKSIADNAGDQYSCLQALVNFQSVTHILKLVRFSNVVRDGSEFLYVRLNPVYSAGVIAAPDGGAVGRQK